MFRSYVIFTLIAAVINVAVHAARASELFDRSGCQIYEFRTLKGDVLTWDEHWNNLNLNNKKHYFTLPNFSVQSDRVVANMHNTCDFDEDGDHYCLNFDSEDHNDNPCNSKYALSFIPVNPNDPNDFTFVIEGHVPGWPYYLHCETAGNCWPIGRGAATVFRAHAVCVSDRNCDDFSRLWRFQ